MITDIYIGVLILVILGYGIQSEKQQVDLYFNCH